MTLGPVRVMGVGVVVTLCVEEVNIHSCTVLYGIAMHCYAMVLDVDNRDTIHISYVYV